MKYEFMQEISIDKSDWKAVKFGDVVFEPKESVKDLESAGIKHVVGLEHIDSEDIHLRRSADILDETTFTKKFTKGDVLFGRRRAYLKKAACADHDGVCSGDIIVMRAKEELLMPELLPFLVNNDSFFDYAIQHSAGGLSPRVKFKDLAKYELLLPSKEQQMKLVNLLLAFDDCIEKKYRALKHSRRVWYTALNNYMIKGLHTDNIELVKTKSGLLDSRLSVIQLKDCISKKPKYGANASSIPLINNLPRYIRITDIDDDGSLFNEEIVTINSDCYEEYLLEHDDFMFARSGNTVGKSFLYKKELGPAVFAGYLIKFRLSRKVLLPEFLFYFSKSLKFENFKAKTVKVGAQPNINAEEYCSMYLPKLDIGEQKIIVEKLDDLSELISQLKQNISHSSKLLKTLLNLVF